MKSSVEVIIFDTTLRDGAQSIPDEHQFPYGKKAEIADAIASFGVGVIEAGFPATQGDAAEVADVAKTVGQTDYSVTTWENSDRTGTIDRSPVIAGLSRAVVSDIDATWGAVSHARYPRIHTFVATDANHMRAKHPGKSPEDVLAMASRAVRYAVDISAEHPGATVEFSAEAASTTDPKFLERVVREVVAQGADVINVPDTVGQRRSRWMFNFYDKVIDWAMRENPAVTISAHNHNDFDMAAANTIELVAAAAHYAQVHDTTVRTQLETTVCGMGERAGNADIFPVAAGLFQFSHDFGDVPIRWQVNPQNAVSVARSVMGYAGFLVDRQSPIVGSDTITHRSGIHSDGVIKGGYSIYTPYEPTFWGHAANAVHQNGRYQGARGRQAAQAPAA